MLSPEKLKEIEADARINIHSSAVVMDLLNDLAGAKQKLEDTLDFLASLEEKLGKAELERLHTFLEAFEVTIP